MLGSGIPPQGAHRPPAGARRLGCGAVSAACMLHVPTRSPTLPDASLLHHLPSYYTPFSGVSSASVSTREFPEGRGFLVKLFTSVFPGPGLQ